MNPLNLSFSLPYNGGSASQYASFGDYKDPYEMFDDLFPKSSTSTSPTSTASSYQPGGGDPLTGISSGSSTAAPAGNLFGGMGDMMWMIILFFCLLKGDSAKPVDVSAFKTAAMTQDGSNYTGLNKTVWEASQQWLQTRDVNSDSQLSLTEFTSNWGYVPDTNDETDYVNTSRDAFETLDRDNNSRLDRYEVAGLLWFRSSTLSTDQENSLLAGGSSEVEEVLGDAVNRIRAASNSTSSY